MLFKGGTQVKLLDKGMPRTFTLAKDWRGPNGILVKTGVETVWMDESSLATFYLLQDWESTMKDSESELLGKDALILGDIAE